MKIESQIQIATPDSRFDLYADGSECAAFFAGESKVLSIGRIRTGNFDESLGLAEKLRRHLANDALSASADSENVIPFGCEYRVKRHWNFSGNIGELTDDIAADNGGRINNLQLEPLTFAGDVEKVSILLFNEDEVKDFAPSGVICDGETLPVWVKVAFKDGSAAEVYCGDDFWRYQGAAVYPGGTARHIITADAGKVVWERQVLTLPEDVEAEKRPWRFKMLFGFTAQSASETPGQAGLTFDGCFAAPAGHKNLRNFIRKQSDGAVPVIAVSGKFCCDDGSHVSRPGRRVAHGMLGEVFDEYIWANSVMARKGGSCILDVDIAPLTASVICGNMRIAPKPLSFPDLEEIAE